MQRLRVCYRTPTSDLFRACSGLNGLTSLRLERAKGVGGDELTQLSKVKGLEKLELVDVVLKEGFGGGLVKLTTLRRMLLIPLYKDEASWTALRQ